MPHVTMQSLRRVAESLGLLKNRTVMDSSIRSDFRQLRLELSNGLMMVVAIEEDETGRARLQVDVVRQPDDSGRQLEVKFDEL
jgi:hypothetical protein